MTSQAHCPSCGAPLVRRPYVGQDEPSQGFDGVFCSVDCAAVYGAVAFNTIGKRLKAPKNEGQ